MMAGLAPPWGKFGHPSQGWTQRGCLRAAQAMSGEEYERGRNPHSLEGVPGELPHFFSKSMSLRMHFRPF